MAFELPPTKWSKRTPILREVANRLSNSSVTQRIGSPNVVSTISAACKVAPSANTGNRAPKCLDPRGQQQP